MCGMDKRQLVPEDKGRLVTAFLESFFERYVEYDFTADLEEKLDKVSDGELDWKDVLRDFWRRLLRRRRRDQGAARLRGARRAERAARRRTSSRRAPTAPTRAPARPAAPASSSLKLGKFGAFIGCSNYPECRYTRQLADARRSGERREPAATATRELGKDPETGLDGHAAHRPLRPLCPARRGEGKEKPKRSSLPKGWDPATLDLERALALLALPRDDRRCTRRPASRSPPASAATGRSSCTTAPIANLERRGGVLGRPQPRRIAACREAGRRRPARPRRRRRR